MARFVFGSVFTKCYRSKPNSEKFGHSTFINAKGL